MNYGELPKHLGLFDIDCKEMMFYQYLPIKMPSATQPIYEPRLQCFDKIIGAILCNFIGEFGLNRYIDSYVYLTAKHMFQPKRVSFNRFGWHSDGFMTDDINYVWCDINPTIFNNSEFNLLLDDKISLEQMQLQAKGKNDIRFFENSLLRLSQFNIHKVDESGIEGMRTFLKISFSKDKYDLVGNSHNYLIDYDWKMNERTLERNIPQST